MTIAKKRLLLSLSLSLVFLLGQSILPIFIVMFPLANSPLVAFSAAVASVSKCPEGFELKLYNDQ